MRNPPIIMHSFYLILLFDITMNSTDKTTCKAKINNMFPGIEITVNEMPLQYYTVNTNIQFKSLCVDTERKKIPWTKAQVNAWKEANLEQPNKLQVIAGNYISGYKLAEANNILPVVIPEE